MAKVNFFSLSGRCMPKLLKIVFTFKFHPLHAKISTPTGTPVPDEKVKELSSIVHISLEQNLTIRSHDAHLSDFEFAATGILNITMEESSLTFSSGRGVPVGVDSSTYNG